MSKALLSCPAWRMHGSRLPYLVPNAVEGFTALIPIKKCIGCRICVKAQPNHLKMLEW